MIIAKKKEKRKKQALVFYVNCKLAHNSDWQADFDKKEKQNKKKSRGP